MTVQPWVCPSPLGAPFPYLHNGDRACSRCAFFTANADYYHLLVGLKARRGLNRAWEMEAESGLGWRLQQASDRE